jgi:hypothetical protein
VNAIEHRQEIRGGRSDRLVDGAFALWPTPLLRMSRGNPLSHRRTPA